MLLCKFPIKLFHSAPAIWILDEPFQFGVPFSDPDVSQESFNEVTSAQSKEEMNQMYFTEIPFISCNNFCLLALSERKIPKLTRSEESFG